MFRKQLFPYSHSPRLCCVVTVERGQINISDTTCIKLLSKMCMIQKYVYTLNLKTRWGSMSPQCQTVTKLAFTPARFKRVRTVKV